MRALCPTTRPSRDARREICLRRELRPARVPVRSRGAADGPCTSPPRRRPKSPRRHHKRTASAGAWRRGRALPALRRADRVSMGRPRPLLRAGDQSKGSLRRPLYDQFEARPHRGLAGPSPPPTHHLVRSTPARPPSMPTRAMWQAATRGRPQPPLRGRVESHGLLLHGVRPHRPPYLHGHYRTTNAHIPGIHTASARVRAPEMSQPPPPPPPEGVQVEGAYFAFGVSE